MSEFTKGKWEIEGTVPFGIKSEASLRIAIVLKLSDARLIAAAPEMYELLKEELIPISDYGGIVSLSREDKIRKLLARIDGDSDAQTEESDP